MGANIHCFIETRRYPKSSSNQWWPWNYYALNPGRDYKMFTLLAGVRDYGTLEPIFPPRGLPEDVSWSTQTEDKRRVSDDDDAGERSVCISRAERWVAEGCSKWLDDEHKWVTDPGNHTHSWLTTAEFEKVIAAYRADKDEAYGDVGPGWLATLAALKAFEAAGEEARLVFWFDN